MQLLRLSVQRTSTQNTHAVLLLSRDWCGRCCEPRLSRRQEQQPEAPSLHATADSGISFSESLETPRRRNHTKVPQGSKREKQLRKQEGLEASSLTATVKNPSNERQSIFTYTLGHTDFCCINGGFNTQCVLYCGFHMKQIRPNVWR